METQTSVDLKGNLVNPPELSYLADGRSILKLLLTLPTARNDKNSKPYWLQISAFGDLADKANQLLSQGDLVAIRGVLQARRWQTKPTDGSEPQERINVACLANKIGKCGSLNDSPDWLKVERKSRKDGHEVEGVEGEASGEPLAGAPA